MQLRASSQAPNTMQTRNYPQTPQTFLSPPTPPPTPPQKFNLPFPSPRASKTEVRSYIRALFATYQQPSALSSRDQKAGMSTLPSFRSIRSLPKITPVEVALCKIWFDGAYLRLLLHVGSLRRELRLLGFEEGTARWLDGEICGRFKGLGVKGKGKYWERKMDQEREGEGGCLSWFFRTL